MMLDTSVLIDLGRNRRIIVDWIQDALASEADLCVSTVAVTEFFAGIAVAGRRRWLDFVETLSVWEATLDIALQAGAYRQTWHVKAGRFRFPTL